LGVLRVAPDSPAAQSGIMAGDTLLALQGQDLVSLADFYRRLSALGPAGSPLTLSVRRQGQVQQIEVISGDRNRSFRRPSGI
jgi:S1-C subfamily serine protease